MKRLVLLGVGPHRLYAHEWVPRYATDGKLVADGSHAGDDVRSPHTSIAPYCRADDPVIGWLVRPWAGSSPRPMSRDQSPSGTFVQGCRPDGQSYSLPLVYTIHGPTRTKPPYPSNIHFSPGKTSMAAAATQR